MRARQQYTKEDTEDDAPEELCLNVLLKGVCDHTIVIATKSKLCTLCLLVMLAHLLDYLLSCQGMLQVALRRCLRHCLP